MKAMNNHSNKLYSLENSSLPEGGPALMMSSEDLARQLRVLWSTIYRNRLLIIMIVAISMIAGLAVTMLMTPKYRATSSIEIDQQASNVLGDKSQALEESDSSSDVDRFLQTQVDVLQSNAMAAAVIQDLDLAEDSKFLESAGVKLATKPLPTMSLDETRKKQALSGIKNGLKVDLPHSSRIVNISFISPDPVLAAKIANAFASDFMMLNMKRKFGSSTYARNYLETQLGDTRIKLEASERALLEYARNANLLDVSGGMVSNGDNGSTAGSGPRSLTTSNLVELNSAYAQAQAARVQAQERWAQASSTPPLQLQEVLSNPAIMQLSQLKAQAQAAYQQELQRHKPDYPEMQQAAAHIAELDRQIGTMANSVRSSIKEQYLTATKQEQALSEQVNGLKGSTQNEQSRSVQYNILKRAVDTNRTMYDGLLQRYSEVSAQAGVAANNISQLDVADVPITPISPKPLINLLLAAVFGVLAAFGFILLRDKFDDSVRTPEDISAKLGLTFLNATPLIGEDFTPLEVLEDPRSPLSEAYIALRTSIELGHKDGAPRSISVTSTRQSEGKSTTAYAVARNFAKIGRNVVLIDADLRKPSLHRLASVNNEAGFSNLLAGLSSIDAVLQTTETAGLSLIAAGPLPPNPAELLSGRLLAELVSGLEQRFDMVIIDAPPVLGLADTILIGTATDVTLFVVEANGSHHGHAKAAVRRLISSNITIIGTVLTKYDARKIGYGYGYGYNYAYSYSYGEADASSLRARKWPWSRV